MPDVDALVSEDERELCNKDILVILWDMWKVFSLESKHTVKQAMTNKKGILQREGKLVGWKGNWKRATGNEISSR